jgi:hypothetical protein
VFWPARTTPLGIHAGFFSDLKVEGHMMKTKIWMLAFLAMPLLQGCTVLAIADVAASTVIYGVKTAVNVVDAVTPDIINRDKDKSKK